MPEMNLTPDYLLTLLVGLIATACQIAFSLSTARLRLLLLSFAAGVGFLIQYLLLEQWVGFYSGLVGITYTALLAVAYRYRSLQAFWVMALAAGGYACVFLIGNDFSQFSLLQTIPLIAGVSSLVALRSQNVIFTKAVFISAGLLWLAYEIYNGMYTQTIGETFELVGNCITLGLLLRAARATKLGLHTLPLQVVSDEQRQLVGERLSRALEEGDVELKELGVVHSQSTFKHAERLSGKSHA